MSQVKEIRKWPSSDWSTVVLDCGHTRRVDRAEMKREGFRVGRKVDCRDMRSYSAPEVDAESALSTGPAN